MSSSHRSGIRPVGGLAMALGVGLLTAGLLGCGGGNGDDRNIVLPPGNGGVAVGNLVCGSSIEPPTTMIKHGDTVTIRFTLTDVNIALPGANLPISFDVVGGTVLNPPTSTDAAGVAIVTFTASDVNFVGAGRVRLVQPDARLNCDVSFTIVQVPCQILVRVYDRLSTDPGPRILLREVSCGRVVLDNVQRSDRRVIEVTVTRVNPFTGVAEPVPFAELRATVTSLGSFTGTTNGFGIFEHEIRPLPTGESIARLILEVVIPDLDGPNNVPDGVPDSLPCCSVEALVNYRINDVCANHNGMANVVYQFPPANAVRPGESATLTAFFVVPGGDPGQGPQVGRTVLVDAEYGFITPPGGLPSEHPVRLVVAADGSVTATYTARSGFAGVDRVTFDDEVGTLECHQLAEVNVQTCAIRLLDPATNMPIAPLNQGDREMVRIELLNTNPITPCGEEFAATAVGAHLSYQEPTLNWQCVGGMIFQDVTMDIHPDFLGASDVTVSHLDYPCLTVTAPFTVVP